MRVTYQTLFFIASVIALASCKNNDNVFAPNISTGLTVVNAFADTLNFYLNGTRQNNNSNLFPDGSVINQIVPAGQQNYQFKKLGASTVLFSVPLNLADSTYNSLYVAGETADLTFHTFDNIPVPSNSLTSDTAYVRFVDAAPNAGNLNVSIMTVITGNVTTADTIKFNNISFKSSSNFMPAISGQNEVKIYVGGSNVANVDTIISFVPNYIYTLYAKGTVNGKGNSVFDVGVLNNN
jgi:hypothetical protein